MKKKLTKKRALEICRDLWRWLAKHKHHCKLGWPGWKIVGEITNDCPCCHYAGLTENEHINCWRCPLKSLWPGHIECEYNTKSPYAKWKVGKNTVKNARIIANACTNELRKMKAKR